MKTSPVFPLPISCGIISLLVFGIGCGGLKLASPLKGGKYDWPVYGNTDARSHATEEVVSPPLTLAWELDMSSGMGYGSPIVIDSILFATNMRGELYCVNAQTGKRIGWVNIGEGVHGSPASDGNYAFIAVTNSRESLVAYDLLEGKIGWRKEYGDLEVTPLLINDRLYFGNTAGIFYSVQKKDGEQQWRFRIPENTKRKGIRTTATTDGNLVFFGAEDGNIYALDLQNGSARWSYNTGSSVSGSPAVINGKVVCGTRSGTLLALDAGSGKLLWKVETGSSIYATPSFSNNLLLVGTTAGILFCLNQNDGSKVWSRQFESVINSSAAISGNIAYVGTLKKEFFAIDITDGSVVWQHALQGRVKSSPAIAHGKVFVATDDKMILAFKPIDVAGK